MRTATATHTTVMTMVAMMIVCAHIPWLRPVAIMLSREGLPDDDGSGDGDGDGAAAKAAA